MPTTTEVFRRVYDDKNGAFVEVCPDRDGLDLIQIHTSQLNSREVLGICNLTLTPEFARALGEAIFVAARELMNQKENQ